MCATLGVAHQIAAKHLSGPDRDTRAERSLTQLGRALALRPEHRVRSKAFDHLGRARTHLVVGEVAGAQEETGTALDFFAQVGSVRVGDRLLELHAEAAPYATTEEGRALRERIGFSVTGR